MVTGMKNRLISVMKLLVAFAPAIAAMYLLYWLGGHGIWDEKTPFRDAMTGAIVATGLVVTFVLYSRLMNISK